MNRKELETRYALFNQFALQDQKKYYKKALGENRKAAAQVNRLRAFMGLMTGVSAAIAGFIVQTQFLGKNSCSATLNVPDDCVAWRTAVVILTVMAVVLPAIAALFSTLADLYQWDKLIAIYRSAMENLEVADAQSPHPQTSDDLIFRASYRAFVEGTLNVMSDETAQWGQSIRTPQQVEHFITEEIEKAQRRMTGRTDSVKG
ncbi:MAG: hypothetical protein SF029_09855 [bacterium]|nr:hypothetical protein [bacterium]